ncbi:MAG: glycosyltransferase family 9 protein [Candidatus Andersenbacteria bacterium]|nr:glycosyltransferase family 9 protein [bacterium]MDZ4225562.1 glycosyltransferase family 9 protein [Candidatus Andersenbacteria bacterium]
MSKKSPNILILSLAGIGNFLIQSPVFRTLKQHYPHARLVVWVAPRGTKALAQTNPYIDEVIEAPIRGSLLFHYQQLWRLRRGHYDIAIMLHPGQLWKGAAYMYLAGIPKRLAHQYPYRHNPQSGFLLTDSVPPNPKLHDIEQNLNLLSKLEIALPAIARKQRLGNCLAGHSSQTTAGKLEIGSSYKINIPNKLTAQANKILKSLNIPPGTTLVGLHPGSSQEFKWKRWPLENFAKLAELLTNQTRYQQTIFLIFGGNDENDIKQKLGELLKRQNTKYKILNTTNLLTTAAIMKNCQLFISNDSGLMHLAAIVGTPTLGLFGPTDENKTGPRGRQSWSVRAPETTPVYDVNTNYNFGSNTHPTLLKLAPEMVLPDIVSKATSLRCASHSFSAGWRCVINRETRQSN